MVKSFFMLPFAAQILFFIASAQNPDPQRRGFIYRGNYVSGVLDKV